METWIEKERMARNGYFCCYCAESSAKLKRHLTTKKHIRNEQHETFIQESRAGEKQQIADEDNNTIPSTEYSPPKAESIFRILDTEEMVIEHIEMIRIITILPALS